MFGFEVLMLLVPVGLLGLGFLVGYAREQRHFRSLEQREAELADITLTDLKTIPQEQTVVGAQLVMGEAVMASDYFKNIASAIRGLVGGEMKSLDSLLRRARREAIVRMLRNARELGASEIHNVRLESSSITRRLGKQKSISAEMFAFGTAIIRRPT